MLCERCREDLLYPQPYHRATWTDLLAVGQALGTTSVALAEPWSRRGPRGPYGPVYQKRALAAAVLRLAGFRWQSIGDLMNRNHSSVISMARRAYKRWPNQIKKAHQAYVDARTAIQERDPPHGVVG